MQKLIFIIYVLKINNTQKYMFFFIKNYIQIYFK